MIGKVNSKPLSGTELNVEFSDTPPTNTSRLWVQAAVPYHTQISDANNMTDSLPELFISSVNQSSANSVVTVTVDKKIVLMRGRSIEIYDTETNINRNLSFTDDDGAYTNMCIFNHNERLNVLAYKYDSANNYRIYLFVSEDIKLSSFSVKLVSQTSALPAPFSTAGNVCVVNNNVVYCAQLGNYIGIFNLATDTFSSTATAPSSGSYTDAVCAYGNSGFICFNKNNGSAVILDIRTLTNSSIGILCSDNYKNYASICLAGSAVYLVGGCYSRYESSSSSSYYANTKRICKLDMNTGNSSTLSFALPNTYHRPGLAFAAGYVYILGGYYKTGFYDKPTAETTCLTDVHRFRAVMMLNNNCCLIQLAEGGKSVTLFSDASYCFDAQINSVWIGNQQNEGCKIKAYVHDGTEWTEIGE